MQPNHPVEKYSRQFGSFPQELEDDPFLLKWPKFSENITVVFRGQFCFFEITTQSSICKLAIFAAYFLYIFYIGTVMVDINPAKKLKIPIRSVIECFNDFVSGRRESENYHWSTCSKTCMKTMYFSNWQTHGPCSIIF